MSRLISIHKLVPKEPALFSSTVAKSAVNKKPIQVKPLSNGDYLIEDGHHRVRAAIDGGAQDIVADLVNGSSDREAKDLYDWAQNKGYLGTGISSIPLVADTLG